jgi:hypothetical protein
VAKHSSDAGDVDRSYVAYALVRAGALRATAFLALRVCGFCPSRRRNQAPRIPGYDSRDGLASAFHIHRAVWSNAR